MNGAPPPESFDEPYLEGLRRMLLVRHFETKVGELYRDGQIPGFVHLSIGQEASAVGVCLALGAADYVTSTHRGHGHCLARGMRPDRMMAELFGKADGYCGGKGGSMHIADPRLGMLGANGIVGAGLPIALGAGVACSLRGEGVSVAFFGEGAVATGAFHEAVNLAAVWDVPVLFACENNSYVEFTHWQDLSRCARVADMGAAYGVEARTIDGGDLDEVFRTASDLVARLRAGEGPFLLEMTTHRHRGHYEGDPQRYRPPDEPDEIRASDPVDRARGLVLDRGLASAGDLDDLEAAVVREIDDAVRFATQSPEPDPREVYTDV